MNPPIPIEFVLAPNHEPGMLTVKVSIDDRECFHGIVDKPTPIRVEVEDAETQYELRIELLGKDLSHTRINEAGEIIQDNVITVSDLRVDGLDLVLYKVMTYTNDTNGTTETISQPFYGIMGCNGVVSMKFSTPIFLWMLEVM